MAEKIEFQISVSKDDLNIALSSATEEAKKTEKAVFRISDAFKDASSEISRIKSSFIGNLGANAVSSAFSSLRSAIGETVTQAREYSRAIAEVNSILPKNQKLTEAQIDTFIRLSSLYGKSAQSEAKAFYEIVSGGVEDTATAFKILRQANEAATAGLTDVNVAAKVLTSTFNAFAQQGTTVNQITDSLFQAVKDGQTTFNELSSTLGRVAPIAASVGIRIDEVAGSIAFLTKSGIQTDQAITGLRAVLSSIIKPSKEAADEANRLGISFGAQAIQKAGGFSNFLNQIRVATNGSSASIARLFGDVNAINTVIAISNGNFKDFTKTLESNKNSIGATSLASKELKDSFDFKAAQAEQSIKNLATSFSVFLLPALLTTLNGFKELTGIGKVSVELDENRKRLKELALEYNNTVSAIDIYKKGLGATAQEILFANKIIKSQADGERKLNEIIQERIKIRQLSQAPTDQPGTKPSAPIVDAVQEAESIKLRQETFQKLALAKSEFDLQEQQRKFDASLLAGETNQIELDSLIAFEQQKLDARFAKEVELTELIKNEDVRRAGLKAIEIQKEISLEAKKNQELAKLKKAEAEETNRILSIRNNYIQAAANIGGAFFKQGSKEAFAIQKAAALAGIIIDDSKARTASVATAATLPPGVREAYLAKQFALITSNTALATSSVAAAAIQGFANGGIVGATQGPDNQLATVRSGEMVLNADQQKSLFDMINSGGMGGEIVVEIDGREVARAVRNQINNGFRLA
jgi:TP901 family phage tail tape measure protein